MFNKRAQSAIEYAVFLTVFIAAIIVMSVYIKRGIQGNWHNNFATLSTDLYDADKTNEQTPLYIKSYDYSINIKEGARNFGSQHVNWVGDGKDWVIWR